MTSKACYGTHLWRSYVARSLQVSIIDWTSCSASDESTGLPLTSRRIISQALENGLFANLRLERKIVICETLLDISSQDAELVGTE
jgi:hypothetical protein